MNDLTPMEFIEAWHSEEVKKLTLPGASSPKPMIFAVVEQASAVSEKPSVSMKQKKPSKT